MPAEQRAPRLGKLGRRIVATATKHKARFAFGLFDGPSGILDAANELLRAGVPRERLSLVLSPELIPPAAGGARGLAGGGQFSAVGRVVKSNPAGTPYSWVAQALGTESASTPAHCSSAKPVLVAEGSLQRWSCERSAQQLNEFLRHGGGLLVVRVTSDSEQHAVCSKLLHSASNGVQTHEIRQA